MTDLFAYASTLPPAQRFDGKTHEAAKDARRLGAQMQAVFTLMSDGKARTLAEIALAVDGSEAGVSARLRDFRKSKYGAHTVLRERVSDGLFRYRLIVRSAAVTESGAAEGDKLA